MKEDLPLVHQYDLLNFCLRLLNPDYGIYRLGVVNKSFEQNGCVYQQEEIVFFCPEFRVVRGELLDLQTVVLETLRFNGDERREHFKGSVDMTCGKVSGVSITYVTEIIR